MADDVTLPGTGAVIATDEVSSKHYQRVKVTFGGDGSATDASSSDPLPVVQTGRTGWFRTSVLNTAARTTTASSPILSQDGANSAFFNLGAPARPNSGAAPLTLKLLATSSGEGDFSLGSATLADGPGGSSLRVLVTPFAGITIPNVTVIQAPLPRQFYLRIENSDGAEWTYFVHVHLCG